MKLLKKEVLLMFKPISLVKNVGEKLVKAELEFIMYLYQKFIFTFNKRKKCRQFFTEWLSFRCIFFLCLSHI